eukprot:10281-Heterococcus_DN1.PRE.4
MCDTAALAHTVSVQYHNWNYCYWYCLYCPTASTNATTTTVATAVLSAITQQCCHCLLHKHYIPAQLRMLPMTQ